MRWIWLSVLVFMPRLADADDGVATAAAVSSPAEDPGAGLFYVEVMGKGGAYGVGYERALTPRLAVGAAASFIVLRGQRITTVAPYAHATIISRGSHALFGELGAALVDSRIPSPVPDWTGMSTLSAGGVGSLGYEHTGRRVVLRATGSLVIGAGGVAPMLGFSIGVRP
jgi:hypothetical protein